MAKRRTKRTPEKPPWADRFIAVLRDTANVRLACHSVGIGRTTAWEWKQVSPEFAAAWKDAEEDACDLLEAEARKRARESSDTLLIFLLKAHRPEKFGDRLTIIKKAAEQVRAAPSGDLLAYLGYSGEPAESG